MYQAVVSKVESGTCTQGFLTRGLCAAIQLRIAKFLPEQNLPISSDVRTTADLAKSVPVFQLFLEYGWDKIAILPSGGNLSVLKYESHIHVGEDTIGADRFYCPRRERSRSGEVEAGRPTLVFRPPRSTLELGHL